MVDGCRAQRDCEPHALARAELIAVHPRPEPAGEPGLEDAAGLVGGERAPFAEHVDPARVRRARVEHRAADELDVVVAAVLELGGHDVGAEEGDLVGHLARERAGALRRRRSARSRS